ncbi:MAG: hypothetical protein WBA74_19940 [Cyclobacteriaceae bacterium]
MQLDRLKPAWEQFKSMNMVQHPDANEILLILEELESDNGGKLSGVVVKIVIFTILTLICQGG